MLELQSGQAELSYPQPLVVEEGMLALTLRPAFGGSALLRCPESPAGVSIQRVERSAYRIPLAF